ncbi:MAG: hypothetical protein A2X42_11420 [Candidatus Margulisbacteria bacterium GWF2_38_17]|nr:MAG: hypothetical protein A2X42_11420 [Candidatus Margulisbacteria bacterium GWF2_38_17]
MGENFEKFFIEDNYDKFLNIKQFIGKNQNLTDRQYNTQWHELINAALRAARISGYVELSAIYEKLAVFPFQEFSRIYGDLPEQFIEKIDRALTLINENISTSEPIAIFNEVRTYFSDTPELPTEAQIVDNIGENGFDKDFSNNLKDLFVEESTDLTNELANDLIEFENNPQNIDIVNKMFRAAHTIKGNAATLGFGKIKELSHKMESVLDMFRKNKLQPSISIIDVLSEGVTLLEEYIHSIHNPKDDQGNLDHYFSKLDEISISGGDINRKKEALSSNHDPVAKEEVTSEKSNDLQSIKSLRRNVVRENQSLRIDSKKLDNIVNLIGEVNIHNNNLSREFKQVLNIVRHDKLMSERNSEELINNLDTFSALILSLQASIVQARMIPFYGIFKKYPTIIRALSRQTGKEISFEFSGENIEVDKSIYEEVADPIMHLIRNCVDHGIESPEQRLKAGKERKGNIKLDAKIEGSQIIITVEDDGKGIDRKKVLAKAVEKGIVTKDRAASFSDKEICDLIFYPGFSTMDTTTEISGRGVGMDVVRLNIHNLKGMISLFSIENVGTKFVMSLPTSLTIREVLIVSNDIHSLGIPVEFIVEVIDVSPLNIFVVENKEVIEYDNKLVPFIYMRNVLGIKTIGTEKNFKTIMLKIFDNYMAISVDVIERRQQIVMKPLNELITQLKFINSTSILGDGSILLLLDVVQIFDRLDSISVPVFKDRHLKDYRRLSILEDSYEPRFMHEDVREYIVLSVYFDDAKNDHKGYYGIEVNKIYQILESTELAVLPDQNSRASGYCTYQEQAVPVYDLSHTLGGRSDVNFKILLIGHHNNYFGILCHKVYKIIRSRNEDLKKVTSINQDDNISVLSDIAFHEDFQEIMIFDTVKLLEKLNKKESYLSLLDQI